MIDSQIKESLSFAKLLEAIKLDALQLGFSSIGISGIDLSQAEPGFLDWLSAGFHGEMDYMARHGLKRARPAELLAGTLSVITARMDYLPESHADDWRDTEEKRLANPHEAVISVYARGRDYHKVMRARLQTLSEKIAIHLELRDAAPSLASQSNPLATRVFVDSAPVLEVELASRSGLGWRGKHTLLLNREAGSMFFLGEIFVNIELPPTPMIESHCGSCSACIDVCPTAAIVAPYQVDARRCISYLTIENKGEIPIEFRRAIGNRIYGCDDCQTACPWNKFAKRALIPDFDVREGMQGATLLDLFAWSEDEFLKRTEGSAIRRIGYERWQRNIAVALGNQLQATSDKALQDAIMAALSERRLQATPLVQEHIDWALNQQD
jgi:epoxyqueuosine reductase